MTFYYVILEKRSYTHKDTQLHTLISYVLLVTLRTTCLVQTAAVVTHALYHREGKKDSEEVGETNWGHKCTPSNHLSLAPSVNDKCSSRPRPDREEQRPKTILTLLYISNLSEAIRRVLAPLDIQVVSHPLRWCLAL